ncbi:MAG: hypothetical protein H0T15_07230 [Thermoleophilaceae bacterium]|nr:hypothetical protein [Thermoleophilaceae bacterium]
MLRAVGLAACAVLVLSFVLFAVDEARSGTQAQREKLGSEQAVEPAPADEGAREQAHSGPRELIDDVNDVLVTPFAGLVDSDSNWVSRGVPLAIGLALYGFGLGLLLNYAAPGRR